VYGSMNERSVFLPRGRDGIRGVGFQAGLDSALSLLIVYVP